MKLFVTVLALALAAISVQAANLDALVKPGFPEGRIINGVNAERGAAPYIVSLKTTSHFCAGSIVDEHWVLTAAHCLIYGNFKVIAGLHERNNEKEVQIREVTSTKQYIIHEKYGGGVGPYDIGLIYIPEAFNLNALSRDGNAKVAAISLPSGKFEQTGNGELYGWGRDNSGALPNVLQTLAVDIINAKECKSALPLGNKLDQNSNVCSYTKGTTDGACNGDSGGPLVKKTSNGYEQVGIVSWGYTPCATTKYPSVYTDVLFFNPWILSTMANYQK